MLLHIVGITAAGVILLGVIVVFCALALAGRINREQETWE